MNVQRPTSSRYLALYAALLLLLVANMGLTLLDTGRLSTPLHLSLAAVSALLVGLTFMRLRNAATLTRLAAGMSLLWVVFLFTLTFSDYLSR